VNPLVKLAASALPGEKKYILFAGAGVSKDAGVATAWDLMLKTAGLIYAAENDDVDNNIDLEKWFTQSAYAGLEFSELMSQIYPNYPDQQNFLKEYLTGYDLGQAHYGIAELARRGIIRAIITTNFDHFIEKALEEKGLDTQVISTDEDLSHSEPLIHCKAIRIYKPHGTLGKGALKNTPKDLEELSPPMEDELVRILNDHGVIILGYAGQDRGIQRIFEKRRFNRYPIFWVNLNQPEGEIKDILEKSDYSYISCEGANQFIEDYLKMLERIKALAPTVGKGPSMPDLRQAIPDAGQPLGAIYSEYLDALLSDLEKTKPDFSKFDEYDDAIVNQIENGVPITYRFIDAALLASKYGNYDGIQALYEFFGKALRTYNIPEGFSGTFSRTDFDGFKFLVYEMFVSLIASLIRNNHWDILGHILAEDLFVEKKYDSKYVSFAHVSEYLGSLDQLRNQRLKKKRVTLMGDMLKERFTNSQLSQLLSHKDFLEADYFLFMRTVSHDENPKYLYDVWCPRACVWLEHVPSYIVKAESKRFLAAMLPATGFSDEASFKENFIKKHGVFTRYFSTGWKDDPLEDFDLNKLGTRK
jgi:hypothetical protein